MRGRTNTVTAVLWASTLASALLAGCDGGETSGNVGPRGGHVISDDGRLTVEIPAGALDETIDLRIEMADDDMSGSMSSTYVLVPAGISLARPAIVTYELEPSDMSGGEDISLWGRFSQRWSRLPDRFMDEEDGVLLATMLVSSEIVVATNGWN